MDLEQGTHSVELAFENSERNLATEPGTFCRIQIQSVALENHDGYFLSALYIACAAIILLCGWTGTLRRYDRILLLAGIGLAASVPLFSDNLCKGDDLLYHITRLEGIYQGLQNGEFPVRINPLQSGGYGNLSPTMYPSLFLYPVAILRFFGVSAMLCYKVTDSNEYCNCIFELLCSACNHRIREISLANECFVYVCHIPAYKSILQSRIGGKPCYGVSSLATVGHL